MSVIGDEVHLSIDGDILTVSGKEAHLFVGGELHQKRTPHPAISIQGVLALRIGDGLGLQEGVEDTEPRKRGRGRIHKIFCSDPMGSWTSNTLP